MRKQLILIILLIGSLPTLAQTGKSTFDFISALPNGARATALGGTNVSLIENDLNLIYQNPAFLGQEMDKGLSLNYSSYIADIGLGSATFAKALGERSAWGVGAYYTNYGDLIKTDESGAQMGDLSAKDICANVFFSRDLSEYLRGGVAAKFIYSDYDHNTAYALAVDLGISYYNRDHNFSFGIVGKNLGRQIKSYEDVINPLPWDIQMGFTKQLALAPIRFSVTGVHLKKWQFRDAQGEKDAFFKTFAKHLVFGVDFIPTDSFWVSLGYNPKRGYDMNLEEGNRMAGFSAGAGLNIKAFSFGFAVAQYHPGATSLVFNVSTFLGNPGL